MDLDTLLHGDREYDAPAAPVDAPPAEDAGWDPAADAAALRDGEFEATLENLRDVKAPKQRANALAYADLKSWAPPGKRNAASKSLAGTVSNCFTCDDGSPILGWEVDDLVETLGERARPVFDAWAAEPGAKKSADEEVEVFKKMLAKSFADAGAHKKRKLTKSASLLATIEAAGAQRAAAKRRQLTDLGNAELFAAQNRHDLRYDVARGWWRFYDGKRWALDDTGEVHRRAKQTIRSMLDEARALGDADDDLRKRLIGHVFKSEAAGRINAMLDLARWEAGVAVGPADLDVDPFLFNVQNGTLDLRTGKLLKHDRAHMITKISDVAFDPAAMAPLFEKFVKEILPDVDTREWVRRWCGYMLTADAREQVMAVFYGCGSNGKSVLAAVLLAILGDYGVVCPSTVLMERRSGGEGIPNDLAKLHSARGTFAAETKAGCKLNDVAVKSMTGGEKITARFLNHEFFDFFPNFKVLLSSNYRPIVSGTDDGIWRRLRLVPFKVKIAEDKKDTKLGEKLKAEYPGILNWLLRGCLGWQRNGLGRAPEIEDATSNYRDEMDPFAEFFEQNCDLDLNPNAGYWASQDLYNSYKNHATGTGIVPVSPKAFAEDLRHRGLKPLKKSGMRGWQGVRLKKRGALS